MRCEKLTPLLPVVLYGVWRASPCGQTKPSSPLHDAWSDNNLQKPAHKERHVHLQQRDIEVPVLYFAKHARAHTRKHVITVQIVLLDIRAYLPKSNHVEMWRECLQNGFFIIVLRDVLNFHEPVQGWVFRWYKQMSDSFLTFQREW